MVVLHLLADGVVRRCAIGTVAFRVALVYSTSRYLEVGSGQFMAVQTPERMLEHVPPFLRGE